MNRIAGLAAVVVFAAAFAQGQVNPDPRAQMLSPAPGATLPGSTVTFTWSDNGLGGDYFLRIGSGPFGTDIFNAIVRVTSVTLTNIPTNGGTIYVDLLTKLKGEWQAPFSYTYTAAKGATPPPASRPVTLTSAGNSASYGAAPMAPGEIVALFGADMGPAAITFFQLDANNRLPTQLAGVRVLFNGIPAPLIYVSGTQSAAIVPFGVAGLPNAQIVVEYNGNVSAALTAPVANTMPGIFSANASGSGPGAIQNADGSSNSAANPAPPGSTVVLYLSGLGPLNPPQPDGAVISGPNLPTLQFPVTVTIGGQAAAIQYQGPAPQAVAGLYQINCVVPDGTAPGPAPVVVTAEGRQSQPNLTVAIR